MGQDRLEAILARHLAEQGCLVERGVELQSFAQDDDKVSVQLKKADGGVEHVDVEILVGCDGAHSAVRKGLGLSFLGKTMEEDWMIVGDIYVKGLSSVSEAIALSSPQRTNWSSGLLARLGWSGRRAR